MNKESAREKYLLYNSLSILLRAVENERTTIDLRNEASVYGTIDHADAYMNVTMKDCIFTDPRGDSCKYDTFFVQARNIRYVHIPPDVRIVPAIKDQLRNLPSARLDPSSTKRTFKTKRAQERQKEDLASVSKLLGAQSTSQSTD